MTIEINSITIDQGIVTITAVDCSEENLQRLERMRDDLTERELNFVFDTRSDKKSFQYLTNWLHRQKSTKDCKTYGEALNSIYGIVTTISGKYLELA